MIPVHRYISHADIAAKDTHLLSATPGKADFPLQKNNSYSLKLVVSSYIKF